jgi:hypothetical protein
MQPPAIETRIQEWFRQRYPEGPQWRLDSFHCFRDLPIELRMIPLMDVVENEITNGGPAQLLWNVFPHWRRVLADCTMGYALIGAIPQRDAIRQFHVLFEQSEKDCRSYVELACDSGELKYFNQWYEFGEGLMDGTSEGLVLPVIGRARDASCVAHYA